MGGTKLSWMGRRCSTLLLDFAPPPLVNFKDYHNLAIRYKGVVDHRNAQLRCGYRSSQGDSP